MRVFEKTGLFDQLIAENLFVLAYFSGSNCSVCNALKPKIERIITEKFPVVYLIEIPVEQHPELAARLSVFTVPVVLFFVEGREYIREVRFIDTSVLQQKITTIFSLYEN